MPAASIKKEQVTTWLMDRRRRPATAHVYFSGELHRGIGQRTRYFNAYGPSMSKNSLSTWLVQQSRLLGRFCKNEWKICDARQTRMGSFRRSVSYVSQKVAAIRQAREHSLDTCIVLTCVHINRNDQLDYTVSFCHKFYQILLWPSSAPSRGALAWLLIYYRIYY